MTELTTKQPDCKLMGFMTQSAFNLTAGVVFALIAMLHAARLALGWSAVLGGWEAPRWVSGLAVLVTGPLAARALSLWLKRCDK